VAWLIFLPLGSIPIFKKVYPHEKKSMPFFHADHLFGRKHAVLEPKQALSEAEKLHKTHAGVQFLSRTHAHPMTVRRQNTAFPLLFHEFRL